MDNQESNDDCYFYYYSSCTKGTSCPFRHSQAALGTEIVCSLWREGRCFRENCKFRHMESRIRRAAIQCYWEDQPSGCLKPHCVFLHRKPRPIIHSNSGSEGLILPVSNSASQVNHAANGSDAKELVKSVIFKPVSESYSNIGSPNGSPPSHPVEPIVVRFDGEESDSESACSTPMKSTNDIKCSSSSVKKNLLDNIADKNENFGIKTLEQIRMEKIHKESEHFYKPDDTVDTVIPDKTVGGIRNAAFLIENNFPFSAYDFDPISCKMKTDSYKLERYPPESEFISVSETHTDKTAISPTSSDSSHHSPERESTFKRRALKRKPMLPYSGKTSPPPKKFVPLKKSSKDNLLNFKIKTLEEIRKERENKLGNNEEINTIHIKLNAIENASSVDNLNEKPTRRLKIKRHTETLPNSTILQAGNSNENVRKENRAQMILHEVQNISEDQSKSEIKGKRKECGDCSESPNPKQIRSNTSLLNSNDSTLDCTSNEMLNDSIVAEKQTKKISRPVIKRKKSSSTPLGKSPSVTEKEIVNSANAPSDAVPQESLVITDPLKEENKASRTSMDEFDNFLNETEVSLDYEPDSGVNETEDILLEIEQLLHS